MEHSFTDEAVVIKRINFSEADRILTVITKNNGKLSAIAKGVRKPTSKKAPHIEPFILSKLHFIKTKGMPIVSQAITLKPYHHLRTNLETTRLTMHVAELIDNLVVENDTQQDIFTDLNIMLEYLDKVGEDMLKKQKIAVGRFQLRILERLGFGHPPNKDLKSTISFIESILDKSLITHKKFS